MKRKTMVLLPAVLGLLAPALAGCGGSDGDGGKDIVVGTTDQLSASKEVPAPLDPAYAYDSGVWNVLRQTVQTLMHIPRGGGLPVPEAAESCGFSDAENESYRCELRSGLKFASGKAITPEDVKYSIDRVLKIKSENGPVSLLSNIDTVETKGEKEVVFHLKAPDATFPYKLSTPTSGIVSRDDYLPDKLRDGFEVDGSGPYTMEAKVEDGQMTSAVFTKNPHYKGDLKVRNEKVELRSFADADAMGKALDEGEIDMMSRTMSPEQVTSLRTSTREDVKLTVLSGLSIRYLGFNTEDPSVKDKAVRQAMASVIDRGQIASQTYASTAEPLYSLIPTTIPTHTNSFYTRYGEPSVKKAADLLRAADVKTPVKVTLNYTTDRYGPATVKEFELLKKQLNASKLFEADIKGTPWKSYREAQKRGDYAVYGLGWFPDFPDPDNFIAPFLDKDNFLNTPYANKKVREVLIPQSRREADRSAAAKTFEQLQDIVAQDVPVLPIWQAKQYVASRVGLTGVEWSVNTSADLQLWELGKGD
ncbi:ABC transporter substrate-binding protein [Streptomyces sp. NPDC050504]|uniref:ABC transporter substrate-binding protein n=1 Tax=Streptomyces sp. NPDC050504 TaxID=3365618 RepID=UPI0037B6D7CF